MFYLNFRSPRPQKLISRIAKIFRTLLEVNTRNYIYLIIFGHPQESPTVACCSYIAAGHRYFNSSIKTTPL